jgi:hypothetical protein
MSKKNKKGENLFNLTLNPKKSWNKQIQEKKGLPKIIEIPQEKYAEWGQGKMVIPSPLDIWEVMNAIQEGKLITGQEIKNHLIKKYKVSIVYPQMTGLFIRLVALATIEKHGNSNKHLTPFWRTLKSSGYLNPQFPGGLEEHAYRLESEGFYIIPGKGSKLPKVKDYQKYIQKIDYLLDQGKCKDMQKNIF